MSRSTFIASYLSQMLDFKMLHLSLLILTPISYHVSSFKHKRFNSRVQLRSDRQLKVAH